MKKLYLLLWISITLIVAGCGGMGTGADATVTASPIPPTPTSTLTPVPTPTPLPPVGVLLAPAGADTELVEKLQSFLSQAIPDQGLRFQVLPSLSAEIIAAEDIQWVIAVPPDPGLNDLVASAPETRFLALGFDELEPEPNLSAIISNDARLDQQGFIAGYIAALITPDWRVGIITVADTTAGEIARQSFITGAKFYCGLCTPSYPPFVEYPMPVRLKAGANAAEWRVAADILIRNGVETIYIAPGGGDETLLQYLAQSEIKMISGVAPPEGLSEYWVATLGFSHLDAFYDFWPDFVNGVDNQSVAIPLTLTDINPNLLSPGRQRLVDQTWSRIEAGFINLGVEQIEEEVP
ncbi:MAG: hypothetical protein U9Q82_15430 [Chloroflexota bacterium]|nr:hypothetical protein [Chloroflexota bacterium]